MVGLHVDVLGPIGAWSSQGPIDLGAARQRAVLTALAFHAGRPVAPDLLAELVWLDTPPATALTTLQGYVAGLRRVLEPERQRRTAASVLVFDGAGYVLRLADGALDAPTFEVEVERAHRKVDDARRRGAVGLLPNGPPEHLQSLRHDLATAIARWRGTPYADLPDGAAVLAERTRLGERRLLALEDVAALDIVLGDPDRAAADLEAVTVDHPWRERLWALRALALARAGRQGDALTTLREVRDLLANELGVDPGAELQAVQEAVLRPAPSRVRGTLPSEPPWPLVGRDIELEALSGLLAQTASESSRPVGLAAVTGEPGIGKSRLCAELARRAPMSGAQVVFARALPDSGAPPLWLWTQVLGAWGQALPTAAGGTDPAARFRAWNEIVTAVLTRAAEHPVLVLLDDLHWADTSSLRVLGLLAAVEQPAPLMLVGTWRNQPAPSGALADVAAGLARRHATRIALGPLGTDATATLFSSVSSSGRDADLDLVARRTAGNPFFVVELARLDDLSVPASVADVVAQRVATLPDDTAQALRVAAVLGPDVDVSTLAGVLEADHAEIVRQLEQARSGGLLVETAVDHFAFAHDLVRESLRDTVGRSRQAVLHTAAAEQLSARFATGQEGAIAHHWLASGPTHADRAWRAARLAADAARLVFAFDESERLLRAALEKVDTDATATAEERCDLLIELAETLRLAGRWSDLRPFVHQAIELARRIGDLDRLLSAAVLPTQGAYWLASPYGIVDRVVENGLRAALAQLPGHDDPRRCRAMLSLASETYYAASVGEREALVDEAVLMARRLGDPGLLVTVCLAGATSIWRPERSEQQHALAAEAAMVATRIGDEESRAAALTISAAAASDLGWIDRLGDYLAAARTAAAPRRQLFSLVLLDSVEIAWRAVQGDQVELDRLAEDLARAAEPMAMAQLTDSFAAVEMMRLLWSGRHVELLELLEAHAAVSVAPVEPFIAVLLCRTGRVEEARDVVGTHGLRLEADDWLSPAVWALGAETALHLSDPAAAATTYARLTPLAGRPATGGSGIIVGPVDLALALAAVAVGERATAARHADDAERLAERWQAPPVLHWVRAQRQRWDF